MSEPLVAIRCAVYNHEFCLRDCLNGFVMQKTSFPFIAVVHDDCSTDDSTVIIREYAEKYPEIIKPIYEEVNCYQNGFWSKADEKIKAVCGNAKYIACCEGDDYWTNPYKLQKQIDFLESHPEYSCCCHRFVEYYEDTKCFSKTDHWHRVITDDMPGIELNKDNYFQIGLLPQILTTVYRKRCLDDSLYYKIKLRSRYDQTFYYALVQEAPIWIMNEYMGVYRRHGGGIATSASGTLRAEKKMYLTWKDAYEAYQTDETRKMYMGNLSSYIYRYIKRAKPFKRNELMGLIAEYKSQNGGHLPLKMKWKILKAFVLRILKRNRYERE